MLNSFANCVKMLLSDLQALNFSEAPQSRPPRCCPRPCRASPRELRSSSGTVCVWPTAATATTRGGENDTGAPLHQDNLIVRTDLFYSYISKIPKRWRLSLHLYGHD